MYNVRSKQQSVKNKKSQDIHSFKSCKLNCSCSANSKFKRNQSDNRFNAKSDPWIQSNKDNDRLLRDELKRYGLDARKFTDSKYKQSCPGHEKCCINVKNTPHICLMQREHHDQPKLKSKTDSNLTFESYVIELKNEIKAQREDIPSLPRKYKQKYLNSIKEELLLNKVASEHEDSKKVKELIREIQIYRANKGTPFVDSMKSATVKSNNVQTGECKDPERCRKNNCKAFSECGSVKGGKGKKIKKRSSNRHKLQGRNGPASSSKVQDSDSPTQEQQPTKIITDEDSEKPNTDVEVNKLEITSAVDTAPSEPDAAKEPDTVEEPDVDKKPDVDKEPDVDQEPDVDKEPDTAKEDIKNKMESDLIKRLDIIDELIPKLSSVIETSEKNLKKTFEEVFQTIKVVQERGVSPIEELVKPPPVEDENLEKQDISTILKEQSSQSQSSYVPEETVGKKDKKKVSKTTFKEYSEKPFIGDLLINIENIRESRCLLEGFQKELSQIKRDINECIECDFHQKSEENSISLDEKYCDKHGIYIPLIKMKYICPKSDQIRIFNALKTEITLKKELENQLQKISKLERELSKVKMSQNQEEIKTIEAALQFTKSYFKNLLVKQETERLLNEQQKILKQDSAHRCQDTKKCDKCSVETQIHEILRKVRESINKDLVEARQRLKVQKMPDINIKQPLQIQHTLRLNIPPTSPPQECVRNNVACETVFADDKNYKSFADREVQTRIFVNKTTGVESQRETKSPKNDKSDSKEKSHGKEGVRILKFLDKSTYCMELSGKKGNSVNDIRIRPKREKCTPDDTYCCKLLKAREAMRESIFEISHKTPSELGFRCTVGTQCDSETSLSEPRITTTVKMTENRLVGVDDSSNYLFGFKEYLRDKSVDCSSVRRSSNKVDVVLQVNLDRSFDSDLDSMAKSTQNEYNKPVWPPTIPKRISVHHDKDEEVSKSTTITDPALTEETNMYSVSKKRLDSRIRSIPRIPSLKKMFFPPEDREEVPVDVKTVSNNLQNELTEVKLKTKRVSNTQEEALDLEIETGDVFYKSLIGTTDLPERKTIISLDNHLKMNTSSTSRQTLRTLSTEDHDEDGQSLVHPVILEQMTENQTVEDVQSIDGEYIEDENGAISPKESNEKKADENLSFDYDLTIDNKEQEQQVDLPIYMSQSEIDNEIVNDMFLPSSQAGNEVPDETKFSYSNYLPSEDITGESPAELHYENLDNELVSKEKTQMLESIVSKIMDNAKDKITEQYEMVQQEPENKTEEEKILEADFNISDFDYTHFPRNKSEEKQKHDESKEDTVLSMFSPNYTLNINKTNKDHKGNILEADFLPNLPIFLKSNKTFENYKSFHDSLQLSDDISHIVEKPSKTTEHSKQHETKTLHYINQVTNDPYGRNEESCKIDRFDFPPRHIERKMLDNSNPKNRLEGLKKIAEERLEYAKKCSKEERSFDSSILSSEGEVKCKCPHVSVGEYHHCPYQKRVRLRNPYPSIQYKKKLSSHIVLENERKHYNHWVTYYSNKKEEESSTSNSIGSKGTKG